MHRRHGLRRQRWSDRPVLRLLAHQRTLGMFDDKLRGLGRIASETRPRWFVLITSLAGSIACSFACGGTAIDGTANGTGGEGAGGAGAGGAGAGGAGTKVPRVHRTSGE